ncbi:hypothetical protein RHSIM_Rhsim08G0201300 [Rhododendron simsii]|uniref:Protein kinase domain-containing protein n=1 Tax=Rhododendron simsii TaxID=118357 RepID=A0A834LGV9_RHOSS|nr:hypothetical protein RHSIM_Rhsim08G0201300 [Rhododendron simsii]
MDKKKYPIGAEHYTLYEEVGQGVSASVHRALCIPFDEIVAIKILDFERNNSDLNNISREAQTMILADHPNVLKSHCSFVSDHNLWVIMPFMAGGSCLHILKVVHPDGFEEVVIATILREVLKGLEYVHHQGHIHRDVKAGNILIDANGAIKLGDFGVSACLFDSAERTRKTFVGTPCWMAPEVMEQLHGYNCKADIWSFGITALELAHGHAPFSKYPPMKVLLMTLQNAPPGLDYERDRKFSKSFKQMIASCLVKDPSKRPSAQKLLKHSFFKKARSNEYIARTLLEGLPALGDRLQALKRKEQDMLAEKKIPDGQKEEMSQDEYKRGISGWNFNLEDVKAQASLIQDEDTQSEKEQGGSLVTASGLDQEKKFQHQLSSLSYCSQVSDPEDNDLMQNLPSCSAVDSIVTINLTKYEKSDDDANIASSTQEHQVSQNSSPSFDDNVENNLAGKHGLVVNGRIFDGMAVQAHQRRGSSSGSIVSPDACFLPSKGEGDKLQNQLQKISTTNDEQDEKAKCAVVQQRGRFKVTSENVELDKVALSPLLQKSHSMQVITQHPSFPLPPPSPSDPTPPKLVGHSLFPMVQSVLHTNIHQREIILSLLKQVSVGDFTVDGGGLPMNTSVAEKSLLEAAHDREKELLREITDLQLRLIRAQEELQKYKTENAQYLTFRCDYSPTGLRKIKSKIINPGTLTKKKKSKYLLYGPFVAKFLHSTVWEGTQRDSWCTHILILCSLRGLIHQLWSSYSNMLFLNRNRRVSQLGIDFKQIDREWDWDNFIILQAFVGSLAYFSFPSSLACLPLWNTKGILCCLILHMMVSEPLYYWIHRLMHSQHLFNNYHWLHHSSKVTHPYTAGHATLLEHLILCVIVGVPIIGTTLMGFGSMSMIYLYVLIFDFLRCLGHCNVEIIPHHLFKIFPFLQYVIYTPTYHGLHHKELGTNFCLFMPLYDALGRTMNYHSWDIHKETSSGKNGKVPDFVFLVHVVDTMQAMHVPFVFRSFSSHPFSIMPFLIPLWPFSFLMMLIMWAKSKTFLISFYNLRNRLLLQTWAVPRFGFQYFLPFAKEGINNQIEEAILRADRLGVKVVSLAALNKNEALNGGGTLFVNKHPNLKVRVVHGNTLTAAVILKEIPQEAEEVFLTGATSKLGRAIAIYLARRRVRVLMLTLSTERFEKIQKEAPKDCQKFLVQVTKYKAAKECKTWIIGKWTTAFEQYWAPSGTSFLQFVVPPIIPFRRDCTYGKLVAMKLPDDVEGLGSCEYQLQRGAVHACHAGGVVHLLEGWSHHEVGAIDVDQIDVVWNAAIKHGLKLF